MLLMPVRSGTCAAPALAGRGLQGVIYFTTLPANQRKVSAVAAVLCGEGNMDALVPGGILAVGDFRFDPRTPRLYSQDAAGA
jgi:hypothetical protein